MGRTSISAVFPAYNDRNTIEGIVRTVASEICRVTDDFEVVVVNDGSKDNTGEILETLRKEFPFLRVIHHETNRGYGAR
jgi:glycosyltransferase involved in cell wall biosynthesis